jgi:hypothetical protein
MTDPQRAAVAQLVARALLTVRQPTGGPLGFLVRAEIESALVPLILAEIRGAADAEAARHADCCVDREDMATLREGVQRIVNKTFIWKRTDADDTLRAVHTIARELLATVGAET